MFNIVLFNPVIPQNTGSIARLCACIDSRLHLIHPLGFQVDEASVKRAGLDYWPHVKVVEHTSWNEFLAAETPKNMAFFTKFAKTPYTSLEFKKNDYLVFGSETKGLPDSIHKSYQDRLFLIPMRTHLVRSLNLAQAAGIVAYEGLRQLNFEGLKN